MKTLITFIALLCPVAIMQGQLANDANAVPAFHPKPPAKGQVLPHILTQKELAERGLTTPLQVAAYTAAARRSKVMYQQPCYCYCDRGHGHTSLHSCFESTHGSACGVCMGEALYAYKMSSKGWTSKMIRDGIIRGDWKLMDLQHPDPIQ